jgi:uncharacterized protein (TIGR02270 family)
VTSQGRIVQVVEEHAVDSAFYWLLRDAAVSQPHFALRHLARLDNHLAAQLDGLLIAGDEGWAACREGLEHNEPGEMFAASVLAFESADPARIGMILDLASGAPELSRALVSALAWIPLAQAGPHLARLVGGKTTGLRRVALAAAAAHRADFGPALTAGLLDGDAALRGRSCRAVGVLGRSDLLWAVERELAAEDPEVLFSAAWSTAVLSPSPEALSALARIAHSESRHRERALETAMRRADPAAGKVWLRRLAQDGTTLRLAVQGAGAIGDPAEIPWLIEHMKVPDLARVAGESFTTITGVDLAYDDLETDRPEGFESGPTEDPADENVELDPDENLPWPDPALIQNWWQSNRHAFQSGTRYLLGKPITVDWCKQVLRVGRQRQRAAAALEISMRQPGTPLFEVRAPGFRQKQLLGMP